MLDYSGNVLVKLMNQQAVKIGKTGIRKLLTLNQKNVRICYTKSTVECHRSTSVSNCFRVLLGSFVWLSSVMNRNVTDILLDFHFSIRTVHVYMSSK